MKKRLKKIPPLLSIACIISFFALLFCIGRFVHTKKNLMAQAQTKAEQTINTAVERFNLNLSILKTIATTFAQDLNSGKIKKEAIETHLQKTLEQNPTLFGMGVAFTPYAFDESKRLYAPYFTRVGQKIVARHVHQTYDYTKPDSPEIRTAWYHEPLKKGAVWNEPYFGTAAKDYLAEYAVPIYDPKIPEKKPIGVVYADFSLDRIHDFIASLELGGSGYGFIITQKGTLVSYPRKKFIHQHKTIFDLAQQFESNKLATIAKQAIEEKEGMGEYVDILTRQPSWIFYKQIPASGWPFMTNFILAKLLGKHMQIMYRQQMNIIISFVIFLLLFFLLLTSAYYGNKKQFLSYCICSASIFMVGIGSVWYLALQAQLNLKELGTITVKKSTIKKILAEENVPEHEAIPTGIFIRNLEFADPMSILINGIMWGTFPRDAKIDETVGVFLPDATTKRKLEKIYKEVHNTQKTIGWDFTYIIRQQFDYSKFPLDKKIITFELHPKAIKKGVLIPDLDAYTLNDPLGRPGINPYFSLQGWTIESSFFNFKSQDFKTTLGLEKLQEDTVRPELFFNIILKRNFIDPFVSYLLPLMVALFILFIALLLTTPGEIFRTLASVTGLFFAIVLAHINVRGKLPQQPVFYLEYFYIITYLMLIFVIVDLARIAYSTQKGNGKATAQNVALRLLYWPMLLGLYFVVTAWVFY